MKLQETATETDRAEVVATVVVRSPVYREYLHLGQTEEGWKIVNSLWHWT